MNRNKKKKNYYYENQGLTKSPCHFRAPAAFLSSFPGVNLGSVKRVLTRDTPSRADQSVFESSSFEPSSSLSSGCISSPLAVRTVPDRGRLAGPDGSSPFSVPILTPSTEVSCSFILNVEDVDMPFVFEFESRNRHTTAQSSTLEVGYLRLQARTADSTSDRAAEERAGAEATISTTSSFERTSQIYEKWSEANFKMIRSIKCKEQAKSI